MYLLATNRLGFTTAGGAQLEINGGTSQIILEQTQALAWGSTGLSTPNLTLHREAADHSFQRRTTSAQRASWANTYTSATNYEAFSVDWQTNANVVAVGSRTAATGTGRETWFEMQHNSAGIFTNVALHRVAPLFRLGLMNTSGTWDQPIAISGNMIHLASLSNTVTSGSVAIIAITPTYNQSSGTAANTDLLINRTETAVGSGTQLLMDAQVGSASRFAVATNGSYAVGGANGQAFTNIRSLTELTTIAAAATTDTTIQMPATSVVLGVSVRTTVTIPTATTYTVGDSGSAARFSTAAVGVTAGTTDPGTKAGAYYNAGALSVRITPNGTPANNNGRVRVTIYYYTVTPPTS